MSLTIKLLAVLAIMNSGYGFNLLDFGNLLTLIPGVAVDNIIESSSPYCVLCKPLVNYLLTKRKHGMQERAISHLMKVACPFLTSTFGEGVCENMIDIFLPHLTYVSDHNPGISAEMCGVFLQEFGCTGKLHEKWSIDILPRNNSIKENNGKSKCEKPFNIIQITDIHYDPKYSPTAKIGCARPLCCQPDDAQAENEADSVGFWGDYQKCDVPIDLMKSAMETAANNHQFDSVYFTGDLISHRSWDLKKEGFVSGFRTVMGDFRGTFGRRVFPILGNHDIFPLNQVVPNTIDDPKFDMKWLYELCVETWRDLLPVGTDMETVRRGGFYSAKARDGLRVIGLNTNVAYTYNFWLLLDDKDPHGQLQWLADTLHQAERAGEKVHILSHLPPGDGTSYIPWFSEFRKVIYRYSHLIEAVFQGHNHITDFNIYYDNEEPVLVGFSGGSVTPFNSENPNYRVYEIDCEEYNVLNYADYIINITESRHNKENPRWFRSYSFKEEYEVEDLSPVSLDGLINRMVKNETLRNIYYNNRNERADPGVAKECDEDCHKDHLCTTVTTLFSDQEKCGEINEKFE